MAKQTLKRALRPMPDFVEKTLRDAGFMEQYQARPPYQRNGYLAWISRAKCQATVDKCLYQMLDELRAGDCYMGMEWGARR